MDKFIYIQNIINDYKLESNIEKNKNLKYKILN